MIVALLAIIAMAILVPWFRYSLRISREDK
jgi:hypothetical protein